MEGMIQNPGWAGLTASAPASFASLRSSAYSRLPANSARTHCCDFSPVEQAIKKTLHMEGMIQNPRGWLDCVCACFVCFAALIGILPSACKLSPNSLL